MKQAPLLEIPEQPEQQPLADLPAQPTVEKASRWKLRSADRSKLVLTAIPLDEVLPADHKARAIVTLLERVDVSRFYTNIRTWEGRAGRRMRDPKTMIAVILYGYSEGVGSMREVAALTAYDPALMWLTGLDTICHTELSEFRREHREGLNQLFVDLLAILDQAKVIDLEQVTVDGTRIRTYAGCDTFRREKTIRKRLEQAQSLVQAMEQSESSEGHSARQLRAQKELVKRLEACQQELERLRESKSSAEEKENARVSISEPESRVMKTATDGYIPAYNVQLMTETQNKAIVNVDVSNVSCDGEHLPTALDQVKEGTGKQPDQVLADGSYITQDNLRQAHERQVELVGPLPDTTVHTLEGLKKRGIDQAFGPQAFVWDEAKKAFRCPQGKALAYQGTQKKDQKRQYDVYQASVGDCALCPHRTQCVGKDKARVLKVQQRNPLVVAHEAKMATEAAKATYRKRGEVAEFPNAWLKEKLGLRKFRLCGLRKAKIEVMWACVSYNLMLWRRQVWLPELQAAC